METRQRSKKQVGKQIREWKQVNDEAQGLIM